MEKELPIYLQTCTECGLPALTFDEQNIARCAKHAAVFIPAGGAPQGDGDEEEAG